MIPGSRVVALWTAQIKQAVLWNRSHGRDRCSIGCPYDPDRTEPDDRMFIATLNEAGEVEVTLEAPERHAPTRALPRTPFHWPSAISDGLLPSPPGAPLESSLLTASSDC